jgi:hypothetical protein
VVLWNEINVWRWPERISTDRYADVLGQYVRQVKRLVGDVPVCFKTAGTWNAQAAIAGAAVADGLGFDVWFANPHDARARREIGQALRMLQTRQKKTTWFFIAEGGRGIAEGATDEARDIDYWDNWPPFRSKREAESILRAYALAGAKGFIYNGPSSEATSDYHDSYRWLGELRSQIVDLMVDTKQPAAVGPTGITAVQAVAAASADGDVQRMLAGSKILRVEVEFSPHWSVWLVHFYSAGRRAAFASVSTEGKVLESGPEEGDQQQPESDR